MNIYVIFIYTFILVILKSSNCSDRYSGYSESSDTEDDDNFDVTQSGQTTQPQYPGYQTPITQLPPVTYPGIQYPGYSPPELPIQPHITHAPPQPQQITITQTPIPYEYYQGYQQQPTPQYPGYHAVPSHPQQPPYYPGPEPYQPPIPQQPQPISQPPQPEELLDLSKKPILPLRPAQQPQPEEPLDLSKKTTQPTYLPFQPVQPIQPRPQQPEEVLDLSKKPTQPVQPITQEKEQKEPLDLSKKDRKTTQPQTSKTAETGQPTHRIYQPTPIYPTPQQPYQIGQSGAFRPYQPQPQYQQPTPLQPPQQPYYGPYQPQGQFGQPQYQQPTPPQEPQQPYYGPYQPGEGDYSVLISKSSNLGPGILGPAPGPLREPSEIIKEYDQLADKLTTAAKDEEYKKQKELDFIKFYKKSKKGDLVPMTEKDYKVLIQSQFSIKFLFDTELEQIIYNEEIIYNHKRGYSYCKLLTYYKKNERFTMYFDDGFIYLRKKAGQWRPSARKPPDYVEFYSKDSEGNEQLLTSEHYFLDFTDRGSFKYTFKIGVKCTKIIVKKQLVWKKTDDVSFPNALSVTSKSNLVLQYDNYIVIYAFMKGQFKRFKSESSKPGFNEY
ncbi:Theileria-specific sub-telomeric protein, SVSP family [Theileria annulata]|uniref:Conserved Theileria-specific sub-telomeric protein, SVSP family n=1 Tax=Theileria annulata TaxID=5874 RepID=Q4UFX4_THEAN|nr:Theileria-specific sub-telomeric protein, SVSP family [Theileria annulata]CAI74015.1 conserved Theileria-specific sub-telomeric protein, SVSP family [Theileria annulata]|eukprot:XP_954695.1 conserved Theileria-specific sub-telomeric protein, SVSP family [Theileria annulata]